MSYKVWNNGFFIIAFLLLVQSISEAGYYNPNLKHSSNSKGLAASPKMIPQSILSVQVTEITSNSALVVWLTDEMSGGRIEYGLDTSYGNIQIWSRGTPGALDTLHSLRLTGLLPDTTYHFRILVQYESGDEQISEDFTFRTLVATDVPTDYSKRINAGGTLFVSNDGREWSPDQAYVEGSWGYVEGRTYLTNDAISNTVDDLLYQTERYQMNAYRFTVPGDGVYHVMLHFAEIFYNVAGQRLFNVSIEQQNVLTDFDIFSQVGHDFAVSYDFEVEVTDGVLDIEFERNLDSPKVSAIEVKSEGATIGAPIFLSVNAINISSQSATITWITNQLTDSQVEYGFDSSYGNLSPLFSDLTTQHSITLPGLNSNQIYHFRVISENAENLISFSQDYFFTTLELGPITTNQAPTAIIDVVGKDIVNNEISVQNNEIVQFIGSNSFDPDGDALLFKWFFGDGTSSTETNPVHTYQQEGTYTVTLLVDDEMWSQYGSNPFIIPIQQPAVTDRGGIIVSDLDGDGLLDYLVSTKDDPLSSQTSRATIGAYSHHGTTLWVKDVDLRINEITHGFPGLFGPGLAAGDVDEDSETEVLHLDTGNSLVIRNGLTGEVERTLALPIPQGGIGRWGLIQIVNLRGVGDRDLILQADHDPQTLEVTNISPWLSAISLDTGELLWSTSEYYGPRHGGFRAADVDNDGLDEVVGGVFIDHDGTRMNSWNYQDIGGDSHLDALNINDIKPEIPGLETVILEERYPRVNNEVAFVNPNQVFTYTSRNGDEPQNTAVADFDPTRAGLEVWIRSRFNEDQRPWVFDANGNVVAEWIMNEKKPVGWSVRGIETIYSIDWSGGDKHYIAGKERHTEGKIAVIDAMTGDFIRWWEEHAARMFVADVSGDYREEIIVLNNNSSEIRIYWNDTVNPNPIKLRKWRQNQYKRQKQNYNYYSP